jgi:hypothetical protein
MEFRKIHDARPRFMSDNMLDMKRIIGLFIPLLCGLSACKADVPTQFAPYSLAPPAETVVGDLGGVPVSIPRDYVRLVEYEGDPHWLEKRKDPPPKRTFDSKIVSFALLIHQPTLKPLTKDNWSAYNKRGFGDNEWMDASVHAGAALNFNSLKMFTNPYTYRQPGHEVYSKPYEYEPLHDVHGLKAWRATRNIVLTPQIVLDDNNRKHSMYNHHLYFAYDNKGKITNYIKCGSGLTSSPGGLNMCEQYFVLWPDMKTQVKINYLAEMLPNWRLYQQQFRALVLSFRTQPDVKPVFTFPPPAPIGEISTIPLPPLRTTSPVKP